MSSTVKLEELKSICETFKNLVRAGFGPNAVNTLLCTNTGKLILTSSGSTILNSVHFSHPLGKMISDSIASTVQVTGNNSKSIVLMLNEIIAQLCKISGERTENYRLKFLKSLHQFRNLLFNKIIRNLKSKAIVTCIVDDEAEKVKSIMKKVISTSLQGKLHSRTFSTITDTILDILFDTEKIEILPDKITEVINQFQLLCIECSGYPVSATKVVDGFIIERDCSYTDPSLFHRRICFVTVGSEIDNVYGKNSSLEVKTQASIAESIKHKDNLVTQIVKVLSDSGVNLILCSEKASEALVNQCRQVGISLALYVPEETLERLRNYCGIHTIFEAQEVLTIRQNEDYKGIAGSCEKVILNGRSCIHLKDVEKSPKSSGEPSIIAKQMLICAPTSGVCNQISSIVISTFKVLKTWIDDGMITDSLLLEDICPLETKDKYANIPIHSHGYSFLGGGAFEIEVFKEVKRYRHDCDCDPEVLEIVENALRIIPLCLLQNSYATNAKQFTFFQIDQLIRRHDGVVGINAKNGTSVISGEDILEAFAGKVSVLINVLDLTEQLLRVDQIVSVTKLPRERDNDVNDLED